MTEPLLPPREPGDGGDGAPAPPQEGGVGFAAIPEPGASTAPAAGASYQPPPVPPPVSPTPPVVPGGPEPPPPPPAAPAKKSSKGLIAGFVAVAAAAIGLILVKFVLPLAIVGIAGEVLDSAFGGPYVRLPGDVRSGFEARLKTALGDTLKDQTDPEQSATILRLVTSGLPRLEDGLVDQNFRLTSKALAASDGASCAAVSRAVVAGTEPPESAASAMINTLSDTDLQQWFEIRIAAVEAEVRGSPAQVVVEDAAVGPLYDKLFAIMSSGDIDTFRALAGGETVEDAALCSAVRSLYASVLTLPAADAVLFARYDVSP